MSVSHHVNDLPPEIVYHIGRFLSAKALAESLVVCKFWNEVLDRLKWVYIGSSQWKCDEFPLRKSPYFMTKTLRLNNSILKQPFLRSDELKNVCLSLQHVRHFEWCNHFNLYPPDFSVILRWTSNLESLSLSVIDPYTLTLEDYGAINQLNRIKRLYLYFYTGKKKDLFPIERMYNVLSRARELAIGGSWWCNLDANRFKMNKQPSDWECEKIMIPIVLLPLTYNCPLLKDVVIVKGLSMSYQSARLSYLFRAENIQKLDIQSPLDNTQTKELLHLLPLLKKLQSIGLFVDCLDLVEFFSGVVSPDKSLQLKAPLLEDLVIHGACVDIRCHYLQKFSEAIFRIMSQRTKLRKLAIYGIKLDAGLTLQEEHWACSDLEFLHVTFLSVYIRDYQSMLNASMILSDQLERCINLKKISIHWGLLALNEKNYRDRDYIRRCLGYLVSSSSNNSQ